MWVVRAWGAFWIEVVMILYVIYFAILEEGRPGPDLRM